jgi:hypothetical protein
MRRELRRDGSKGKDEGRIMMKDELELFPCVVRPLGGEITKGKKEKES